MYSDLFEYFYYKRLAEKEVTDYKKELLKLIKINAEHGRQEALRDFPYAEKYIDLFQHIEDLVGQIQSGKSTSKRG